MGLEALPVLASIARFIDTGGAYLWLIFAALVLMWALILERLLFIRFLYPRRRARVADRWRAQAHHRSWAANRIREAILSREDLALQRGLPLIRTLIALCPLLGLLGTVLGMVSVFDVVAVMGTGTPRAFADGISRATFSTLAGMVAALSGVYFLALLRRMATYQRQCLASQLHLGEG